MSSSAPRGERVIHQDYIARIRYSNTLPPPPNPPKLLDIPNTGLSSGQYTTPGYASRLAREQALNIEADAELGMPLDLVGMPGIFDGDESSIQAPLHAPAPHPHDRALLRPLSSLGKPKFSDSGVSFLRRTEYISSYTSKSRFESTTSKGLIKNTGSKIRRQPINIDKESPEYIKSQVEKSFEIAADQLANPAKVKHPSKRNIKLVESFPILPDLEAFTDMGGYFTVKFLTNPVAPSSTYDTRLEGSILRPIEQPPEVEALYQAQLEAYQLDPERNPAPKEIQDYEFYMTEGAEQARNLKRKINPYDPQVDSEELYDEPNGEYGGGYFSMKRIRAYETAAQTGEIGKYDEEVIIAANDGSDGHRQKAVYYYPVPKRISIRPQRSKNISKHRLEHYEDPRSVDEIKLSIQAPEEDVIAQREWYKENFVGMPAPPEEEHAEGDADADGEEDMVDEGAHSPIARADEDADGESDDN